MYFYPNKKKGQDRIVQLLPNLLNNGRKIRN
jgi:hypothetical protein